MRLSLVASACACWFLGCGGTEADNGDSGQPLDAGTDVGTIVDTDLSEPSDDMSVSGSDMPPGTSLDADTPPDMMASNGPCEFNGIDPSYEQHVTWNDDSWLNYVGLTDDPAADGTYEKIAIVIYEQRGGIIGPSTVTLGSSTWDHTQVFASAECEDVGVPCRRFLATTGTLVIDEAGKNLGDPFDARLTGVSMREYEIFDDGIRWVIGGGTFCVESVELTGGTLPI